MKLAIRLATATILVSLFTLSAVPIPAVSQQAASTSAPNRSSKSGSTASSTATGMNGGPYSRNIKSPSLSGRSNSATSRTLPSTHPAFIRVKTPAGTTA